MPALLLCQGDVGAKNLLRRAIQTRYGINPPAIENLEIGFKGRSRVKVGPVKTWVPLDVSAYFQFPTKARLDFVVKPMGLPVQRGTEAFDGATYRMTRGAKLTGSLDDDTQVASVRRRLWAMTALLLTPMSDHTTQLVGRDSLSFEAQNRDFGDSVLVRMNEDGFVTSVEVDCVNTDEGELQTYALRPSVEQHNVNGLMVPDVIQAYWNDVLSYEMRPEKADTMTALDQSLFALDEVMN